MLQLLKSIFFKTAGKQSLESATIMSEIKTLRKQRYDGRSKKRKWEERRSDYVATEDGGVSENKKVKDETFERIKRRKFVLLLGYSGANYFGMQRNYGHKTIEEDLLTALFKANLITQESYDQAQAMQFQRAARTDKGVSAVRQIVSLKMPEQFTVDDINQYLPPEVKVFGTRRVTKGFNSKSQCDARTYAYMLPTIAFVSPEEATSSIEEFRLKADVLENVNRLLQNYVGTKNYHNFTCKKKPTDPSASRHMKSFVCETPILRKNVEFAIMKVKGQSFMMHQIRKMVGLILAISRGHVKEDILDKAFSLEKVNIPRAPGLGLMLEFVHYDRYNNRYGSDGVHEKLLWEEEKEKVDEFAEKYIFPSIIDTEINEKAMLTWLESNLSRHTFDGPQEEDANEEDGEDEDEEPSENGCKEGGDDRAETADADSDLKRQSSAQ